MLSLKVGAMDNSPERNCHSLAGQFLLIRLCVISNHSCDDITVKLTADIGTRESYIMWNGGYGIVMNCCISGTFNHWSRFANVIARRIDKRDIANG